MFSLLITIVSGFIYFVSFFIDTIRKKIDNKLIDMYIKSNHKIVLFFIIIFNILYIYVYFIYNIIVWFAFLLIRFLRLDLIELLSLTLRVLLFFLISFIMGLQLFPLLWLVYTLYYIFFKHKKKIFLEESLYNNIFIYLNTYLLDIINILIKMSSTKVKYILSFLDLAREGPLGPSPKGKKGKNIKPFNNRNRKFSTTLQKKNLL